VYCGKPGVSKHIPGNTYWRLKNIYRLHKGHKQLLELILRKIICGVTYILSVSKILFETFSDAVNLKEMLGIIISNGPYAIFLSRLT
jgi:hypothetical protein